MERCTRMIVTYPSSFRRSWCTVSEKSTSEFFSHFPFFSKSVHPLIRNLLWEMYNDGVNMLTEFQIKPIYRLGEMAKRSSGCDHAAAAAWTGRVERGNERVQLRSVQRAPAQEKTAINHQSSYHTCSKWRSTHACSKTLHKATTHGLQVRDLTLFLYCMNVIRSIAWMNEMVVVKRIGGQPTGHPHLVQQLSVGGYATSAISRKNWNQVVVTV